MSEKTLKIFLFSAIAINFYLTLGLTPLFNLDEGAFSEATREMLLNHDFITTYLNGSLRFDKPILIYWLQALSVSVFGLNEFSLRLPSAVAATFWAGAVYFFTKKLYDEKSAIFAAFFMVTALQIGLIAKAAIADSLLNMFIAFSMFSLFLYIKEKKEKYLLFSFAFIGFGFLTKGPVAVLVPLATYFLYTLVKKDMKTFFRDVLNIKGIVIFLIIALPWYIAEYMAQGQKFIDGFFLKHNLHRFESSMEKHRGSLFYFIPVLLIGLLPWTSLLIKYLTGLKEKLKQKDDFFLFGSIWFLFVFLFFSFSGTKLPHYVIYGYTPLFIFMGLYFREIKNEFLLSLPMIIFVILLAGLPFVAENIIQNQKESVQNIFYVLKPYFNTFYYLSLGTILALLLLRFTKEKKVIILGFSMIFILNYVGWIYAHAREFPVKHAAEYVKKQKIGNIVMYHINTPSFNVYAGMLVEKRKPKVGDIVISKPSALKKYNYKTLFKEGTIVIAKIEK